MIFVALLRGSLLVSGHEETEVPGERSDLSRKFSRQGKGEWF